MLEKDGLEVREVLSFSTHVPVLLVEGDRPLPSHLLVSEELLMATYDRVERVRRFRRCRFEISFRVKMLLLGRGIATTT